MTARRGLADEVAAQLLAGVTDGRRPPGSRLPPESVLAREARVSRLTLREAVRVLRDKGVLRVEQGRGTFVNPPARWSALDPVLLTSRVALEGDPGRSAELITETRRIVEVGAVELAARRRVEADLAHLRGCVDRMRRAHEGGDVVEFSAADVDFHDGLVTAARNPFLAALLQPVTALVRDVRLRTSVEPDVRLAAVAAHSAILDAVAAGDADAARRCMTEHLAEASRVVERLRATGGSAGGPADAPATDQEAS